MKSADKERYEDDFILEVATALRAATSHLQWSRVQALIMTRCKVTETAAGRLVWGLATGYRKPPPGMLPPGGSLTYGEEFAVKLYLKNFQNDINNAAAFLGVTVEVYQQHMDRITSQGRPKLTDV